MRLRHALVHELLLQRRYGFGYAAVFSVALWLAILLPIPAGSREVFAPIVLFTDLAVIGFFFIAGSLFFEKQDRTVFALVVTPLRFGEYLSAKVAGLTLLSVVLSFLVVLPAHGTDFAPAPMLAGVVLTTVQLLLLSFVTALPYRAITDWLVPSGFWLTGISLPLLHYSGVWEHPILYLIPTQGSLLLLGTAFGQVSPAPWEIGYAVAYPLVWIAVLALLARWAFTRYIVTGEGT